MGGWDRVIDPRTGDYVDDLHGSTVTTTTAATALYHAIKTERNHWVGDPDAGSRLYQLPMKLSDENVRTALDMLKEAVGPLVDAGLIVDYQVAADEDEAGRLVLLGTAEDAQRNQLDLSPLLPGGV